MPDEGWRDEIQEYALLLDAVASGDRSRVVKHLTEYILNKKEGNQGPQPKDQASKEEQEQEQEQHPEQDENGYEYYEEEAYNDPYGEHSADQEGNYTGEEKDLGYEDEQYQYENGYDEYDPAEYGASGAPETYYEGPYMSGAYNEPEHDVGQHGEEPYENYTSVDPSGYGNEAYATGADDPAHMSYAAEAYDGTNPNSYVGDVYPEDQQYGEEYYDPEADGTYNDWKQEGEPYLYQQGTGGAGGEWHEESDYGLFSDDQIQEGVDEAILDELDEEYFEEDELHPQDDHTYSEEQEPLDDDDVLPEYQPEEPELQESHPEENFPLYDTSEDTLPLYDTTEDGLPFDDTADEPLPFYEEATLPPHDTTEGAVPLQGVIEDTPPEYTEVPRSVSSPPQQRQYVPYRPGLARLEERAGTETPTNRRADRFGFGTRADTVEFDEDEWEDDACGDDDTTRSPFSPNRTDLRFNPLSQQYEREVSGHRPNPFLYLSPIESDTAWGRRWR